MGARYDVVIVGAGHNGLVAAGYLAKAGKSVLVLEGRENVGGTATTEEIEPGFRASVCFDTADAFHPSITKDLALRRHGLELLPGGGGVCVPSAGHGWLATDAKGRLRSGGVEISKRDGKALRSFERFVRRVASTLEPLYTSPLPDLDTLDTGDKLDLLRIGWRLRRLGRADMQEAMRLLPMPIRDVVEERFDNELLRAAVAGRGISGSWLGPYSAGSTFNLVHHLIGNGKVLGGPTFVRGGGGALTAALAAAARDAGAEIRTSATVRQITAELGRVTGVVDDDGDSFEGGVVLSNADPKRTFLGLVDPTILAPEFVTAVRNIRSRPGVGIVAFALDGLPRFAANGGGAGIDEAALRGYLQVGSSVENLERSFDAAKYGGIPEHPYVRLTIPSLTDASLAPDGKHVAVAWVQTVPYELTHGSWEEGREALGDAAVAAIEELAPGFASLVRQRLVVGPADIEARFGATGGCLYHAELSLDQALYLRPLPGWARYRTPLEGLYLCGSGTHGGGGLNGLPGHNAALQVLDDLKNRRGR